MVMGELAQETEILVIGSGPGGYAAAFRAADLGFDVTMVDPNPLPGGVCLYNGCIPSKTLLHVTELIHNTSNAATMGVTFTQPEIDLGKLRSWKNSVISKMSQGLKSLNQQRDIQLIQGKAKFESSTSVRLTDSEIHRITFQHAIIATGSKPIAFPGTDFRQNGPIMSSSEALELTDIPQKLLLLGAGYVGLELGTVYAALGSNVDLVELEAKLFPALDRDLVAPLTKRLESLFSSIHFNTKVTSLKELDDGVEVFLENETSPRFYNRVLVAIGRSPNSHNLGLENTSVTLDKKGYISVDDKQTTSDAHILAVGDVTGGMMLAHKATREGKVAAEVIAKLPSAFDSRAIPAIVYTDPQIAWCGITEEQAKNEKIAIKVLKFPWKYSGRAASMGATDGLTKLITDPENGRVLGMGITGHNTEGLISEGVLAMEMGAIAEDLALIIHPHPTYSETIGEAAELFHGNATHIISKKKMAGK